MVVSDISWSDVGKDSIGSSAGGGVDGRAGGALISMLGSSPWKASESLLGLDLYRLLVGGVELPEPAWPSRARSLASASIIKLAAASGLVAAAKARGPPPFWRSLLSMTVKKPGNFFSSAFSL